MRTASSSSEGPLQLTPDASEYAAARQALPRLLSISIVLPFPCGQPTAVVLLWDAVLVAERQVAVGAPMRYVSLLAANIADPHL